MAASSPDTADLPPRYRWPALVTLALTIALYGWWPLFASPEGTQWGDGQYFHKLLEAFRVSLVRYHEFPLWDPYECGGRPLWDNPQSIVASPLAWLAPFLGTTLTLKVWYVAHTMAGFLGMWLFLRRDIGVSRAGALAASTAWACGGFSMHHYGVGHTAFVGFAFMPLALFLWREGETDARAAMGVGLLAALTAASGGALPLLYLAVLLGTETLMRLWPWRRALRVLRAAAITAATSLGVGAVKLLPVMDQLQRHKRPLGRDFDHMTVAQVIDAFTNRTINHMGHLPGLHYVWGEYGTYIGWVLLLLALVGLLTAPRQHRWLHVLFVSSAVLMVGYFGPSSPWGFLNHYVYPLKEMRVPSRFNGELTVVVLTFAALGADRLGELLGRLPFLAHAPAAFRDGIRTAIPLLAVLGGGDALGRGMQIVHEYGAVSPAQAVGLTPSPRLYLGGQDIASYIDQPQQNRGRQQCYDPWSFYDGAPLWDGDLPQVRTTNTSSEVSSDRRTPNTFAFHIKALVPTRVQLNTSYDEGWTTTVGIPAEDNKQLVVDIPPGDFDVIVRYRPRFFLPGLALSLVSLVVVAVFWVQRSRRPPPPSSSSGVRPSSAPLVAAVLLAGLFAFPKNAQAHAIGISQSSWHWRDATTVEGQFAFARREFQPGAEGGQVETLDANRALLVRRGSVPCTVSEQRQGPLEEDGYFWVVTFLCPASEDVVSIDFRFLEGWAATHRHLARIEHRGALTDALLSATSSTLVMRPLREASAANSSLDVSTPTSAEENRASVGNIGSFETFCGAVHMGAEHILAGWDHLLFLATLLLGIAATRSLLFAMTAFTVAHSITLALAALGLWTPSPRWVEPAIAASIAISAGVSLTSTKALRPWRLTFALGLLHGFGFASALDQLGLRGSRGITVLLGFNLGVEAGQLAVLAVGLPLVGLLSTYEAPGFLSRENALRTLGLTGACVFVNRLFWP